MGWAIGYDDRWKRDIGYGVPALCDHPACNARIDRGLAYVCGGNPYGEEHGCGLFFCYDHLGFYGRRDSNGEISHPQLCEQCGKKRKRLFTPKADVREWIKHKLTDPSWEQWRKESPAEVAALRAVVPASTQNVPFSTKEK